jgi:hypothetical protein
MKNHRLAVAFAAAGALALPASAQAATYAESVLADNPLAYLRLDETTGSIAQDASVHDADGTYNGSPLLGQGSAFQDAGTAVKLGAADSITSSVAGASGTVELWVNPARLSKGQQAGIAAHGDPNGDGWALGVGAKRKLAFRSGGVTVTSRVNLAANAWTMLTVTFDDKKVLIYRNGVLAKSVNRNGAVPA